MPVNENGPAGRVPSRAEYSRTAFDSGVGLSPGVVEFLVGCDLAAKAQEPSSSFGIDVALGCDRRDGHSPPNNRSRPCRSAVVVDGAVTLQRGTTNRGLQVSGARRNRNLVHRSRGRHNGRPLEPDRALGRLHTAAAGALRDEGRSAYTTTTSADSASAAGHSTLSVGVTGETEGQHGQNGQSSKQSETFMVSISLFLRNGTFPWPVPAS